MVSTLLSKAFQLYSESSEDDWDCDMEFAQTDEYFLRLAYEVVMVCTNELPSDIIIEIGEMPFHLHKFPLLNRSGFLQKIINEKHVENGKDFVLQLHDLPGGAKTFELIVKFCYDVKIELNAHNVVAVRCAAEHLSMTEDHFEGNLIAQTEIFLNGIYGDWKDSMNVLETCEEFLPLAEELHIVTRCINSLAMKACTDPNVFGWPMSGRSSTKGSEGNALWNGIFSTAEKPKFVEADWWYDDASALCLPLYKRLILAMESRGMRPEGIAGSLMFYSKRYLRGLSRNSSFHDGTSRVNPIGPVSAPSESEQRSLVEEIVGLLPREKGVTSTTFLLRMLRTAMIIHASPACRENLESRIGVQLHEACLEDLLIPNLGYSVETLYDMDCVQRMLDHFMSTNHSALAVSPGAVIDETQLIDSMPSLTPMTMVAKLVDGYLAEVASDVNLKYTKFQTLGAVIPDYARPIDDGIYRAIDIYLKCHPWLTDSEREQLCRLMNCQKLSLEACMHAAQNERLPLRVVVQVLFFEQLRLRTSIAGWFFVSDNVENSVNNNYASCGNLAITKSNDLVGIAENEITELEGHKNEGMVMGIEDVRQRLAELEKDCSNMRQEIEELGKPSKSSSWSLICKKFPKLGFGSSYHSG
ncbi:BTB/POZ domain-containing protein [Apostasia shenzhenica]|uniref:BTB/POZ domain-containing protein n=1 Tax=Apostasia shenzhenica TaxID=1088818 RepID=A0A2H9ZXA3_9ASPA|nr:BTB/POZ domain-containing protein [Apostasia shenzhenica]